jgi:hypothetical protein
MSDSEFLRRKLSEDFVRLERVRQPGPYLGLTLAACLFLFGLAEFLAFTRAERKPRDGKVERLPLTDLQSESQRPDVKQMLQSPADGLILAGSAALLTALGAGLWLGLKRDDAFLSELAKGNLVGMSVANAVYALVIIMAGVLMRRLTARLVTLVCVVIAGLFVPAVGALNVVMELKTIPQWPVLIPMWLGAPVAIWATVVLFRRDVRAASEAQASSRSAVQQVQRG